MLQPELHIVFAGHEVERSGLAFVREDEIEECIELCFRLRLGNLGDGLTIKFLEIRVYHTRNHDAATAAAVEV